MLTLKNVLTKICPFGTWSRVCVCEVKYVIEIYSSSLASVDLSRLSCTNLVMSSSDRSPL